jgi:hypothetical protein
MGQAFPYGSLQQSDNGSRSPNTSSSFSPEYCKIVAIFREPTAKYWKFHFIAD